VWLCSRQIVIHFVTQRRAAAASGILRKHLMRCSLNVDVPGVHRQV
jgi:hypothetical protein